MVEPDNKRKRKVGVRQVLLGSVLLNENVIKWMPVVAMLTLIGILMISNRFKGEKILREMVIVQDKVKELRSEAVTVEAELMNRSRYSVIIEDAQQMGLNLKQPDDPPVKLKVGK
ncbi:MAG: hypothetical protein JW798_09695 [Prolixibacteraceae bacterium]|nr:hypothetical protein [Prolixibacteraceae bacterium]